MVYKISLLYSMDVDNDSKLNRLLKNWKSGGLFFSSWLNRNEYSNQLMQQYRKSGWFSSLAKGVMYRTGDKVSAWGALSCYNAQEEKNVYIAAHSALELFGFNHYIPMGKPSLVIGYPTNEKVPAWMKEDHFEEYNLEFFTTKVFQKTEFTTIIKNGFNILTSVPEQAFLECLLLAPNRYSYMDLFHIMEQLTTMRADILQLLLENLTNNKVKRLFLYMAQKSGHTWFYKLDVSKINIGTGKRMLLENGVYIPEYLITIPKELHEYE